MNVEELLSITKRGKAFVASTLGGFQMVTGIMSIPASFIAGFLWDRGGLSIPLYFSLALTFVASLLLFFVREKE
jgi:MFS-type transporter involved in bile tolerance (Atg22 family)